MRPMRTLGAILRRGARGGPSPLGSLCSGGRGRCAPDGRECRAGHARWAGLLLGVERRAGGPVRLLEERHGAEGGMQERVHRRRPGARRVPARPPVPPVRRRPPVEDRGGEPGRPPRHPERPPPRPGRSGCVPRPPFAEPRPGDAQFVARHRACAAPSPGARSGRQVGPAPGHRDRSRIARRTASFTSADAASEAMPAIGIGRTRPEATPARAVPRNGRRIDPTRGIRCRGQDVDRALAAASSAS